MTKALLRKNVHKYVDQVDEKTLRLVNALLTEALHLQDEGESMLTDAQYEEVERRSKSLEAGETKTITWGKLKSEIRKNHKAKSK
jgi:putative addiction module component (TIGR02574 family)